MEPLIRVQNLMKIYNPGENEVRALDDVSLDIGQGEFVAIIGQSGSGKSTFMNMLGCLDVPTSGHYYLNGKDVSSLSDDELSEIRNQEIGFIFQGFNLIQNLTALENVELPLIYRNVPAAERKRLSEESLKRVGLEKRMDHKPTEMSGGQQQRVAIARALAMDTEILLMDEPFGAIDAKNRVNLQKLLMRLWEGYGKRKTVVFVTHDLDEAILLSDKIILMSPSPGRVYKEITVPFARPRNIKELVRTDEYNTFYEELLTLFHGENVDEFDDDKDEVE